MKSLAIAVAAMLCVDAAHAQKTQNTEKQTEWSYTGASGPEHWGDLSPEYSACNTGKEQSPVDIRHIEIASLPPLQFDYRPSPLKLINNGHTVQVDYAEGSSITVGGERYQLRQLHFHRPSEERIDGKAFDMVLHLVHANAKGEIAVIAVLLEKGSANPTIAKIWAEIPGTVGQEREVRGVEINTAALLPADTTYYTYRGSLTTPPCTEGVTWVVLKTPVAISVEQIRAFASIFPPNARPGQPLGARIVRRGR
jgi:carbonic anhydrase